MATVTKHTIALIREYRALAAQKREIEVRQRKLKSLLTAQVHRNQTVQLRKENLVMFWDHRDPVHVEAHTRPAHWRISFRKPKGPGEIA